jgi:hypothetical protein
MVTNFEWSTLRFGKHQGKSLPEVILTDPGWFYWAYSNSIFREPLNEEAGEIASSASRIKPPKDDWKNWRIHYQISEDKRLLDFSVIDAQTVSHLPQNGVVSEHLDLSLPARLRDCGHRTRYDLMLKSTYRHYFGGSEPSGSDCEWFFHNFRNFLTSENVSPEQ